MSLLGSIRDRVTGGSSGSSDSSDSSDSSSDSRSDAQRAADNYDSGGSNQTAESGDVDVILGTRQRDRQNRSMLDML